MKEVISALKADHDDIVKKQNKIKSSKIEVDQEIEKYDGIINENKARISTLRKKVSCLLKFKIIYSSLLILRLETDVGYLLHMKTYLEFLSVF